ncbi:MAG: class II glutamine amidotransferase [Candidatus Lokiarchaeota archaeon]|nr:class II glutamine amidotransferase [Candidatus Lokiarchaeota archaeon]
MCELLGLCFNKEVNTRISFNEFKLHSEGNPDGWGLGFYPDRAVRIFKEPITAKTSRLVEFIREYEEIRSKIFISHIRLTSGTKVCYRNTHPFCRELGGKQYVFAHNGTLGWYKKKDGLELGDYRTVGETDSEWAFCWLMEQLKNRFGTEKDSTKKWSHDDFDWLHEKFLYINEFGNFNCLMSEGVHLFSYYDKRGYNSLLYLIRKKPFGSIRLLDDDFQINLRDEKDPDEQGVIIATRPLTDENWVSFKPGQLIVVENGRILFN